MHKMMPTEVPMSDELAKKLGYVNADAYSNYRYIMDISLTDVQRSTIIKRLCNLEQLVLESKQQIETLDSRLIGTGTERIG